MIDADELRIIAKDGGRLTIADRQIIAAAADSLETLSTALIKMQADLIEAQAKQIAAHERIAELSKPPPRPFCILGGPVSMSTGMVQIALRDYPGKFTP